MNAPVQEYLREWEVSRSGSTVKVCQCPDGLLGLGSTVWDAGLVLCAFLDTPAGQDLVAQRSCIELGAGTGLVSLVAASLGARHVVASDKDEQIVNFIRQNIGLNARGTNCSAAVLDWCSDALLPAPPGEEGGAFDWVLCADCVYESALVPGLVSTLKRLAPRMGIILTNERREDHDVNSIAEERFFKALYEAGFTGKFVDQAELSPDWQCADIEIWLFQAPREARRGC